MISRTDLAVDVLAASRIVRLVQRDEMPVGRLRERVLAEHGDKTAAQLFVCPWCLGVWVAAGVAAARALFPRAWQTVARILAGSYAVGWLAERE